MIDHSSAPEKTEIYGKKHRKDNRIAVLLLVPVVGVLALVILIPGIIAGGLSFFSYRLGQAPAFTGLMNYKYLFNNSDFIFSIVRNLLFVGIVVFFQLFLGLIISLVLVRKFPFQKFWVACLLAPMAVSPSVAAVIWRYLLNYNIGPVNYILSSAGFPRIEWLTHPVFAFVSICLVYIWQSTPHIIIALYPARLTIPSTLYEAADIDGANTFQSFWTITLPLLKPVIVIMAIFRTMIGFRNFGLVWTLTRGGPNNATELISIFLYNEGFRYWRFGSASAVAVIMVLITLLISGKYIRMMQNNTFGSQTHA